MDRLGTCHFLLHIQIKLHIFCHVPNLFLNDVDLTRVRALKGLYSWAIENGERLIADMAHKAAVNITTVWGRGTFCYKSIEKQLKI